MKTLSIQSHVVSGYVGNKAAIPVLLYRGIECDTINTVMFSNHTGFSRIERVDKHFVGFAGRKSTRQDIVDLFEGLKKNKLLNQYTHVLTGYVGAIDTLEAVGDILRECKEKAFILVDPVMGDNDKMYVPETLLPLYRDVLLPLANLITPNRYEAQWLSGMKIESESDVLQVLVNFHDKGAQMVVITGVQIERSYACYASGPSSKFKVRISMLNESFTGTGDFFAASLLAYGQAEGQPFDLKEGCEMALSALHHVLTQTLDYKSQKMYEMKQQGIAVDAITELQYRDLRIVQSRDFIQAPQKIFYAMDLK